MKKITLLILLGLSVTALIYCNEAGYQEPEVVGPVLTPNQSKITQADNAFGLKLFKQLVSEDPDSNVFISPLSAATALAMTANGAAGETETEMYHTLGFEGLERAQINQTLERLVSYLTSLDSTVSTEIANSIWYRQGIDFKQSFLKINQDYFDAEIAGLDFSSNEAADIINNWVSNATHDKITSIVEKPIDPSLVMFLINAIYFKGTWTYQFEDSLTRTESFYCQDGTISEVNLMRMESTFDYHTNDYAQVIDLPYGDEKYSMLLLLPESSVSISDLINMLTPELLNDWTAACDSADGSLYLPKFRIEYEKSLNEALQELGIGKAFNPSEADFSGMRDQNDLAISKVKHKSFVEVNEAGTEAAAVTSVEVILTSVGSLFVMRCDRPFLFVIHERDSGTILFIGKIASLNQ